MWTWWISEEMEWNAVLESVPAELLSRVFASWSIAVTSNLSSSWRLPFSVALLLQRESTLNSDKAAMTIGKQFTALGSIPLESCHCWWWKNAALDSVLEIANESSSQVLVVLDAWSVVVVINNLCARRCHIFCSPLMLALFIVSCGA